ncbi:hypothetical protein [Rossellomorea marisflavi]|uniref:hypothetical protein n=1 Tax=Rossellomorea marisflavi TaxID=189381 RepID=UPI003FA0D239
MLTTFTVAPSYAPGKSVLEYLSKEYFILASVSTEVGEDVVKAEMVIDGDASVQIGSTNFQFEFELGEEERIRIQNHTLPTSELAKRKPLEQKHFEFVQKPTYMVVFKRNGNEFKRQVFTDELDWMNLPTCAELYRRLTQMLQVLLPSQDVQSIKDKKERLDKYPTVFDIPLKENVGTGVEIYDDLRNIEVEYAERLGDGGECQLFCRPSGKADDNGSFVTVRLEFPEKSFIRAGAVIKFLEEEILNCFNGTAD